VKKRYDFIGGHPFIFLGQPNSQIQADKLNGLPVCISYANYSPWLKHYLQTFYLLLVDSGAFSAFNSGKELDREAYERWSIRFMNTLPEMVELAYKHGKWIGLGLLPPRTGKATWVKEAISRIPDNLHIHGWAMREYTNIPRLDSTDSTNWFRDAMKLNKDLYWLTYGECLELIIKRYQREAKIIDDEPEHPTLWGHMNETSNPHISKSIETSVTTSRFLSCGPKNLQKNKLQKDTEAKIIDDEPEHPMFWGHNERNL